MNTQTRCSGCPAGEEKSEVMREVQRQSSSEGQGGRKGLEERRKLDGRKLVKLVAGVGGEKVSRETSWRLF